VKCENGIPQLFAKTHRRHIKGTSKIGAQIGDRVWSFECSARGGLRKQWQNWKSLYLFIIYLFITWWRKFL